MGSFIQEKPVVRFCYRKIIEVQAAGHWEQAVWEDTYAEFRIQFQVFLAGQQVTSFSALRRSTPAAERLHFLVSGAAINYVRRLEGIIPDIRDNAGQLFLSFHDFRLEIIESDIQQQSKHKIALLFYSIPMRWVGHVGEYMLISCADNIAGEVPAHLFSIPPTLNIHTIQS
ncbi:MAG TPA: hypothetical protein PKC69_11930 [Chitinophagaceae bacterium]|nr:hypothetical protein [Chitinophagaceae bacterium]